jgi:hypothetical protein
MTGVAIDLTLRDRSAVEMTMRIGTKVVGTVDLDASAIEEHILTFARFRASLADAVPEQLDPGAKPLAVQSPKWHVPPTKLASGYALDVRHPGYGWMRFVFSDNDAAQIADHLRRDNPLASK